MGEGVTGTVAHDLGSHTSSGALVASRSIASRPLDLGVRWTEKGNAWSLEAAAKPVSGHKVFAAFNPVTRATVASWTADLGDGASAQIAHNFAKGSTGLTAARVVGGDKLVAGYTLPDRIATASWGRGPLRFGVKSKQRASDGAFGAPSVSLSVDRSFEWDPVLPWARAPPPPPPPPKTNPLLDGSLLRRLGELDANRSLKGVAVETFNRPARA